MMHGPANIKRISVICEFRDRSGLRGRIWADRDDDNVLAEEAILTMVKTRVGVSEIWVTAILTSLE